MDFNVTHFLVSKTGQALASATDPTSFLNATTNRVNLNAGQIGVMQIDSYGNYATDADAGDTDFVAVPTDSNTLTLGNRGIKIFQGLDRTDPIGAEIGYLSSGDILYKNITSLRLLKGVSTETAQVKFFGGTVSVASDKFVFGPLSDTDGARVATLEVEADKDYSFSVRAQSAQANTLSPHGLIWGTSVKANNNYNGVVHNLYAPFSVAWGIVKGFADYKPLQDFVKVSAYLQVLDETGQGTDGGNIQSFLFHYGTAPSSTTFNYKAGGLANAANQLVPVDSATNTTWQLAVAGLTSFDINNVSSSAVIAGDHYTLTIIVEALPQPNFVNNSDITLFPYKWDFVRTQGFFVAGPLAPSPFDTITTQTPIVASRSETGVITSLTYNTATTGTGALFALNTADVRFPNLLTREVRHMAHQYQSYALKYKQQFSGVKYNPMLLDPQQTIYVDGAATDVYDVLMIEYAPNQDYSYSSTSLMTQMTMVAGSTTNQKTQLGKLGAALATAAGITLITDTAV
jgi:hypothetical protein